MTRSSFSHWSVRQIAYRYHAYLVLRILMRLAF